MDRIPYLNLKKKYLNSKKEFDEAYAKFMHSGRYILGEEVNEFEKEFAEYSGNKFCLGVANGLDALFLSLVSLGIGKGDEVIVPANTYIATWLAVTHTGARVVPVEPDLKTYNIDVNLIEENITEKTKAILPVHLYGRPAEMEEIEKLSKIHKLHVIVDCAQAHGSRLRGNSIGNYGDINCYSFFPSKNLGGFGDGGGICLNDEKIFNKLKSLRNYGSEIKYYNDYRGYNSRLDPIQASFLRIELKKLSENNKLRQTIAKKYLTQIINEKLVIPDKQSWKNSVWHIFPVITDNRDHFQNYLSLKGIDTIIHYPIPPHLSEAYSNYNYSETDFPKTEKIAKSELSIPLNPYLKDEEIDFIIRIINEY